MSAHANQFDAIEVLTRPTGARDSFCALVGEDGDDASLIRAMLAARSGTSVRERAAVDSLARLAAIIRAHEAFVAGLINQDELRRGMESQEAATHGFERFGPARVWLRTTAEVLADRTLDEQRVSRQLVGLHKLMLESLCEQLTGEESGTPPPADSLVSTDAWREEYRIHDHELSEQLDELARECIEGPANYARGGFGAAAFVRGWTAVPVIADRLGDQHGEAQRVLAFLLDAGECDLLQIKRGAGSRYKMSGRTVTVTNGLRRCYSFPPTLEDVTRALSGDRGRCLFTTPSRDFLILEDEDHYVVAGPAETTEVLCGGSKVEAMAVFREALEALSVDGEVPEHLELVERRYARLRPRGRR